MAKIKLYPASKLSLAEIMETQRIIQKIAYHYNAEEYCGFLPLITSQVKESTIKESSKKKILEYINTRLNKELYSPAFGYWSCFETKIITIQRVQYTHNLTVATLIHSFLFSLQEELTIKENTIRKSLRVGVL